METRIGYATSSPNIALIKYWGKKDEKNNIPTNRSVSITLTKLITKTKILESINEDLLFINGKRRIITDRMKMLLNEFKKLGDNKFVRIESENNFPDSCGLASSASGISALVKALNDFYGLKLNDEELSRWARFGSGSASRSIFSGFVCCEGEYSRKIKDCDLRVFVVIVDNVEKKVSSTEGMIRTVKTSNLFKYRLENIEKKVENGIEFIKNDNFEDLAELTMKESNEMHSVFLDSYPPIHYLSEKSCSIMELCHEINKNGIKVMYTFDASPNGFIITRNEDFECIMEIFKKKGFEIMIAK